MTISVFDYMDARLFLQDYARARKAAESKFSYAAWALELGFSNKTILRLILQGKRQISPKSSQAFKFAIKLNALESEYFDVLVDYSQARKAHQKQALGARLIQVQRKNLSQKIISPDSGILTSVYGPLVVTLISSSEEPLNCQKIAGLLALDNLKTRKIIDELVGADLVLEDSQQNYIPAQATFKIVDQFGNSRLGEFYKYWIARSVLAIELPAESRRFKSLQIALSKEEFEETISRLNEFALTLISRFEKNTLRDRNLYMINSAVFPVGASGI